MDEQTKKNFLAYEELKIEEKLIKEKLETLKEFLLPHIEPGQKIQATAGHFELKQRDNWTFTPETVRMAENLKEVQKAEIAKGVAKSVPTLFIEYRGNKKTG
jgi:hypothetical protein